MSNNLGRFFLMFLKQLRLITESNSPIAYKCKSEIEPKYITHTPTPLGSVALMKTGMESLEDLFQKNPRLIIYQMTK